METRPKTLFEKTGYLFQGIFKGIWVGVLWVQTIHYGGKQKYRKVLEKIEKFENLNFPISISTIRFLLYKGLALSCMDEFQACIDPLKQALQFIKNERLTPANRDYLFAFAHYVGGYAEKRINQGKLEFFQKVDYAKIKLDEVSETWRLNFQLLEHPDWKTKK